MAFKFEVNGVNLLPYIAHDGLKWSRYDIEAPDAGRTLDGLMHRGRVAIKVRMDVTCRPLTSSEAAIVLGAIEPEYVTVQYTDPRRNTNVTRTMYSNNIPVQCKIAYDEGAGLWSGLVFPLVEV